MNILLIAKGTEPTDGWGTLARNTALGLMERGHTVELLVQNIDPTISAKQTKGLPSPLSMLTNPLSILRAARVVKKTIRKCKPDMIHVLTEPYALAFFLIPSRLRHPWVLTGSGTYTVLPFTLPLASHLIRKMYRDVDHVLTVSTYTKKRLLAEVQERASALSEPLTKKLSVYTLGIEQPAQSSRKQEKHEEKRILFVGGVKERKGVREIIEACGVFQKQSSLPFRLDIIGSLPNNRYTDTLRKRIEELGLKNKVHLRGHVSAEELSEAYASADLFMMLSIPKGMNFEGFGLVFLEANARGIPVIGPNDSGCIDAIANGRSGFTTDPHSSEEVCKAMQQILEQGAIDAEECRRFAKEHSLERQAQEAEVIYHSVLRSYD